MLDYSLSRHWFIGHLIEKYTKGKKIGIDIGVGTDNWKEFKNCDMIGIDKQYNNKLNVLVNLENGLPFKDNIFDVGIAINSLNYINNSRYLLNEIHRVLKTNAPLVCIVDNEKSKNRPAIWEQRYLDRILKVTGFRSILSKDFKDYLCAQWYNRTSVYAFAVVEKETIKESFVTNCFKCGHPLGKQRKKDSQSGKLIHVQCPTMDTTKVWASSYNIQTTHPES